MYVGISDQLITIMISGKGFNELYKGISFVKLTNEESVHNKFAYKEGLNEDVLEFDPINDCVPGGLYFCKYEDFGRWINYRDELIMYTWDVKIPGTAKVVVMNDKVKCNKFILSNKRSIWDNEELCLEAVKQKGNALKYVKEQTEEMCLEAVKQNGYALRFVKEQTEEMCLVAVKQNGWALEYVKEQTDEICLEAVKQNGDALHFVKVEQTEELCLEAVKQNGRALKYVKERTEETCLEAVKQNGDAFHFVSDELKAICQEYLNNIETNVDIANAHQST